ncbi:MAG: alpha/beta hydrolase family protein [Kiritimatiellia bacterium]|jgi:pimeloyl-ACP methyl ester carboxylesterase
MNMKRIKEIAWLGEDCVGGRIKGVVLAFHGLGGGLKSGPSTEELEWGRAGGLVVHPYYGPWSWMNRQARTMIDELVDAVYSAYGLADGIPLVCTGGSMGGQGSLLYTRYAKRPVSACLANCPVCDLKHHFHERPDLPPTLWHAFRGYPESMSRCLAEHSPLQQVAAMPDIPYRIIHGGKDKAVSKRHHSDKMVAAMREHRLNVEYVEVAGMGHGGPLPLGVLEGNVTFVASAMSR